MTAIWIERPIRPANDFYEGFLGNGGTVMQAAAMIVASSEYFQKNGNQNADFVVAIYPDFLGRPANPGGLLFYADSLGNGAANRDLIAALVGSEEYFGLVT